MEKMGCRFGKLFCGCVIRHMIYGICSIHKKRKHQKCCLDGSHLMKDGSNVILMAPTTRMEREQQVLFFEITLVVSGEDRQDGMIPVWTR